MANTLRQVIAVVAGVAIASIVLMAIEAAAHASLADEGRFLAAAMGLGAAALLGGVVAELIGRSTRLPWLIAAVLAGLSLINLFAFPHPTWFAPVAAGPLIVGAWLATVVSRRTKVVS